MSHRLHPSAAIQDSLTDEVPRGLSFFHVVALLSTIVRGRLAADKQKRETFARIAQHLRASWLLTFMPKLPPDHTKEMVTRYLR
jgi:hypothetical protein